MMPNALQRFAPCAGPMVFSVRTVVRLGLSSGALMTRSPIANATDATAVLGTLMI